MYEGEKKRRNCKVKLEEKTYVVWSAARVRASSHRCRRQWTVPACGSGCAKLLPVAESQGCSLMSMIGGDWNLGFRSSEPWNLTTLTHSSLIEPYTELRREFMMQHLPWAHDGWWCAQAPVIRAFWYVRTQLKDIYNYASKPHTECCQHVVKDDRAMYASALRRISRYWQWLWLTYSRYARLCWGLL